MSALSRIIQIIEENPPQEAAAMILENDTVIAHFEQREANALRRLMRQDGQCPTCGADA